MCICSSYHFNGNCDKYIHCLQVPVNHYVTWRTITRLSSLQITHPLRKGWPQDRVSTSLALFEQWCGFFYVRQEPEKWKSCETGHGFSSLSEIAVLPTRKLKKQWTLLNFSSRRVNVVLYGTAEVTFESVDEMNGMTIQKNPLPQYFHVVQFVIQNFPKLNLEFSLRLVFILITYGSKRVIDWQKWTPIRPALIVRLIETGKLLRDTKDLSSGCPLRIVISSPWIDRSISKFQISQRKLECHGKWRTKLGSTCT